MEEGEPVERSHDSRHSISKVLAASPGFDEPDASHLIGCRPCAASTTCRCMCTGPSMAR